MKDLIFPFAIIFIMLSILFYSMNKYYDCDKKGGVIVKSGLTSKCIKAEVINEN